MSRACPLGKSIKTKDSLHLAHSWIQMYSIRRYVFKSRIGNLNNNDGDGDGDGYENVT